MRSSRVSIFDQVLSFIEDPEPARFEPLALRVFRHQFDSIASYRAFCLSLGANPNNVRALDDIPCVSTLAFKHCELRGGTCERIFLTSGTTEGEKRGRHFVPRLDVYRKSAIRHLATMLFPDRRKLAMLAMHPTAERMPESSLSQMISWCIDEFGRAPVACVADRDGLAAAGALTFLDAAERAGEPVCILGTTASFAALFESIRERRRTIKLSADSRMMDTGGAKGQAAPQEPRMIAARAQALLAIPESMVVNEYGMTEMCSQLYDETPLNSSRTEPIGERRKRPPPWLRARALDPVTMRALPDGVIGLLSFFDLANAGSVSALVTEDCGFVMDGAVRIVGRAPAADSRGCALGIAQFAALEPAR